MALIALVFVCLFAAAAPATAQSHYVGASLVGDIARFSRVEIDSNNPFTLLPNDTSPDGEALGVGVVAGTALGEHWGLELEFVRPAALEHTFSERFPPRGLPIPTIPTTFPLPVFDINIVTELRHTTIAATAWVRQELGQQFDLVYFGGVTFNRSELTQRVDLGGDPALLGLIGISLVPETHVVEHGVGPAVGVEGRWKLAEHFSIVPGLRLHGVSLGGRPGWLIRPSVGIRWRF